MAQQNIRSRVLVEFTMEEALVVAVVMGRRANYGAKAGTDADAFHAVEQAIDAHTERFGEQR